MLYVNLPFGPAHGWGVCGNTRLANSPGSNPSGHNRAFGDECRARPPRILQLRDLLTTVGEGTMAGLLNGTQVADGPLLQGIGDERLLPRRLRSGPK